jgi:carbamoyltransferase
MKIMGINHDTLISSSALIVDGEVVAAIPEERLNRQKKYRNFPEKSFKYCLNANNLNIQDLDCITQSWNPGIHMEKFHPMASGHRRYRHEILYSIPDHILGIAGRPEVNYIEQNLVINNSKISILYLDHHLCHAANAFYLSPHTEAAILTVDGRGEKITAGMYVGKNNRIEQLNEVLFPESLGSFYSTFTEYLGFKPENDEWKVMALSAMAPYNNEYTPIVRKSIKFIEETGGFELDLSLFKEHVYELPHYYTDKFIKLFGLPRQPSEPITEKHYKIAAAMHCITEEILTKMLDNLYEKTKLDSVCCSGGIFMNSVFNGKVLRKTKFKNCFISSCPDDSGLSIGGALYAYHDIFKKTKRYSQKHNYYGPEFNDEKIFEIIKKFNLEKLTSKPNNLSKTVAKLLRDQHLVGWFQGKMEFGQRALGNRSILADPRDSKMKDIINAAVKYREGFRPFAPAILEDKIDEYFDIDENVTVPFMEKVYKFKDEVKKKIPAVVHDDGSGRLQGVSKETNPKFYLLINEFYKLTQIPVLLNTSFNLNGEPIVCSPEDAIRTFSTCGLTDLAIGSYLISKP